MGLEPSGQSGPPWAQKLNKVVSVPLGVIALCRFCTQPGCSDGAGPTGLVQGADGNFYGTTYGGGAYGAGEVFKITPGGTLTTLYNFCMHTGCPDGAAPCAVLMQQATNGNL